MTRNMKLRTAITVSLALMVSLTTSAQGEANAHNVSSEVLNMQFAKHSQRCINDMEKLIERLGKSDEIRSKVVSMNKSIECWAFQYVYEIGDKGFSFEQVPKLIREMETTLKRNSEHATYSMFRSPHSEYYDVNPLSSEITYYINEENDKYGHFFSYACEDKDLSISISNYMTRDGNTSYLLVWKPTIFTDRQGKYFCSIGGYINRISGNGWRTHNYQSLQSQYEQKKDRYDIDLSNMADTVTGKVVVEQLRLLQNKYAEEWKHDDKSRKAAIVTLMKNTVNRYGGEFTAAQINEIENIVYKNIPKNPDYIDRMLYEVWHGVLSKSRQAHNVIEKSYTTSLFTETKSLDDMFFRSEYAKLKQEKFYVANMKDKSRVKVQISGTANGRKLIASGSDVETSYRIPVKDDKFKMEISRYRNSIITLTGDNGRQLFVIADSIPVEVDMREARIIKGSDVNMRFMAVQEEIKRFATEVNKYAIKLENRDMDILDQDGHGRLFNDFKEYIIRTVNDNRNNAIPAYLLYNVYTQLSYDELERCLSNKVLSNNWKKENTDICLDNLLMQPVITHFQGLARRQPGKMYHNERLYADVSRSAKLEDYVGKGKYVLLYFWGNNTPAARRGFNEVKKLHEKYGDKQLTIVAISLDNTPRISDWKDYIRRKGYDKWVNLFHNGLQSSVAFSYGITSLPESVLIDPDGKIVAQGEMYDALLRKVEEIIGKPR